ncbi:MAG TPA: hypothetical protein VGD81_19035 [Opitutaceae bacterium]
MPLSPEQKQAVSRWIATGDSLSLVQKKLFEEFKLSLTYMDVRFLVDDLNLELKDAAPKVDASDITKAEKAAPGRPAPAEKTEKKGFLDKAKEKLGLSGKAEDEDAAMPDELAEEDLADATLADDLAAGGAHSVRVAVDNVTLIPGALASGTVTFSDGVTGKWIVDNYGRPGFTEVSKPGYRPSAADAQAFMQELSLALQQKGY